VAVSLVLVVLEARHRLRQPQPRSLPPTLNRRSRGTKSEYAATAPDCLDAVTGEAARGRTLTRIFHATIRGLSRSMVTRHSYESADVLRHGFRLSEQFRPGVAASESGWGVMGELNLAKVRALAPQ